MRQLNQWRADFTPLDSPYMLDAAVVRYDREPGILYQHGIIRDDTIIFEKQDFEFFGIRAGQDLHFWLEAEDAGLNSSLELIVVKAGREQSFGKPGDKELYLKFPDFDHFRLRLRVSGAGATRLIAIHADIKKKEPLTWQFTI